jgi:SAM-dependent methyltransferase
MSKPFSEACEQNKIPILNVLRQTFADRRAVLEIGSGTGQHAVYFAAQLPHLQWYASDIAENHPGISAWMADYPGDNLLGPLELDVNQAPWPQLEVDAVFSANTVHIMHWPAVERMFAGVGERLSPGGVFCLYGPFNYHGEYTAESNQRFDQFLRARDPDSGVRDVDDLDTLAEKHGLELRDDFAMPADNRLLCWIKI